MGANARQVAVRASGSGIITGTGLGTTPSVTTNPALDGEGAESFCSDAPQHRSASAWLTMRFVPSLRESDSCIGHGPFEQQAMRASGAGIQPAHRAGLPPVRASTRSAAERRLLKVSTLLGCWREPEVSKGSRHSSTMVVDCLLLMARTRQKPDLLQGTLDLLILRTLQWGPQHGHGIGVALRASSDEVLNVDHGSLYPALHRLERQGWVDAEWKLSDNNQRAKYYRITADGRRQLALERTRWSRLSAAIAKVLGPA